METRRESVTDFFLPSEETLFVNLLDDGGDELGADSGGNKVALPGFIVIELFFILPRLT